MTPTFWAHRYRGHTITGRVTWTGESVAVLLIQPDGGIIRKAVRSVRAAKSFITRYVRRDQSN